MFIIFVVAMVIINNAMMMATLQRVREVGTMRAIGAQRGSCSAWCWWRRWCWAWSSARAGAALGCWHHGAAGTAGIPARQRRAVLLLLRAAAVPTLSAGNIVAALVIVIVVTALSTLYPAFLATRVPPVRAMQTDE